MLWAKKIIYEKTTINYLVVKLDQFLIIHDQLKMILRKISGGIETLQSIKKPLPKKDYYS